MRECTTDLNGIETCIDYRVFSQLKEYQLNYIRERAKQLILAVAPDHKQRNAALGLLSAEETQTIKDRIQSIRTISNQKEAQIEAVIWNGNPETHAIACDEIETIIWE